MAIEFWGVDVKAGQPLKVWPGYDRVIHLSQASVGELKRDTNDAIPLTLKFGEQKLVLGTLLSKTIPQIAFDLVFQTEFELSHNWKNGSVYFSGYDGEIAEGKPFGKPFFDSSDSSSDSSDSSSDSEKKRHVLPLETAADDAKKGSPHKTTPHPAKQVAKTANYKSKAASPKSAGSVSCNTCSKTFTSDGALQSHAKAKHTSK